MSASTGIETDSPGISTISVTGSIGADPTSAALVTTIVAELSEAAVVLLVLDELTASPEVLRTLVVDVLARARGGTLRIVANDPAGIGTVTRAGLHNLVPVHRSVAAATQAHLDQFDG